MKLQIVSSPGKHEKGSPVGTSSEQSLYCEWMDSTGTKFHIYPDHPTTSVQKRQRGLEGPSTSLRTSAKGLVIYKLT